MEAGVITNCKFIFLLTEDTLTSTAHSAAYYIKTQGKLLLQLVCGEMKVLMTSKSLIIMSIHYGHFVKCPMKTIIFVCENKTFWYIHVHVRLCIGNQTLKS